MSTNPVGVLAIQSALWSTGFIGAADIVRAACDVLAAGDGGMAMAMLGAIPFRFADDEAPALIPDALAEVGLPYFERGSDAGQAAALKEMAARLLSGALTTRGLTEWAHTVIGHDGCALGLTLVSLQDHYWMAEDVADYYVSQEGIPSLDAEVIEEARRLVSLDTESPQ